jgi:hypothetical protein
MSNQQNLKYLRELNSAFLFSGGFLEKELGEVFIVYLLKFLFFGGIGV